VSERCGCVAEDERTRCPGSGRGHAPSGLERFYSRIGQFERPVASAGVQKAGYKEVMTSTLSSERAQNLYRRLGYEDYGCLLLTGEPLEIILSKKLA
jgi:hypothetical protein